MATKNSMSQVTRKPSQPATEGIPGKRFRPFRRTRKVINAIALTALVLLCSSNFGDCLEFSGGVRDAGLVDVVVEVVVDHVQGLAELARRGWLVGST